MKLIHISDLHLGKRLFEYSMLEDQEFILKRILGVVEEEKPDGVLIAGDVYDKTVPSAEAVQLFDDFLVSLQKTGTQVFVISGNHDSAEWIAFGGRLMDASGIHMSPVYGGKTEPYELKDVHGIVKIWLLPFVKPAHVRRYLGEGVSSYTDAVRAAVSAMEIDPAERNVLVTHQFVTGARRSESEEVSVGGADNVDASVFEPFDYVALGHLHSPQNCGSDRVRYCGTPLKYSFSEAKDGKSVSVVELGEKGSLSVRTVPLAPKRDMVELKGKYEDLTLRSFYEGKSWQEDYVHVTLTDEEDVPDAIGKLRAVYHRLMKLDYDNRRTRTDRTVSGAEEVESKTPFQLFSEFYELQNNQPMSGEQTEYVRSLIQDIWEEEA